MRAVLVALLICKATAFFSGSLIALRRTNFLVEESQRQCGPILARPADQEDATEEDDPESSEADQIDMIDTELAKLMKGLEHGSSRETARGRAGRRGDMDEMKIIMLLRQQMGEEDFYQVFDPRNPRIGDV
eukprot:g2022.t1